MDSFRLYSLHSNYLCLNELIVLYILHINIRASPHDQFFVNCEIGCLGKTGSSRHIYFCLYFETCIMFSLAVKFDFLVSKFGKFNFLDIENCMFLSINYIYLLEKSLWFNKQVSGLIQSICFQINL